MPRDQKTPHRPRPDVDADLPTRGAPRNAPAEVLQALPPEGAPQHDHDLYGAPIRPSRTP